MESNPNLSYNLSSLDHNRINYDNSVILNCEINNFILDTSTFTGTSNYNSNSRSKTNNTISLEISNIIENNENVFTTADTYNLNQRIVTERTEINMNTK